jgi:DNA-binding NtrC family response regulator
MNRNPRPYRLLLLEQEALALEDELAEASLACGTIQCEKARWSESLRSVSDVCGDGPVDLIVAVASSQQGQALRFFEWLREHRGVVPLLGVLPGEASEKLLKATSEAVDDFILWPARREELSLRVSRMLSGSRHDLEAVRNRLIVESGLSSLVGSDPVFLQTIQEIPRVAESEGTVLITGETGTGKELCARAIHQLSRRRSFPFIPVDCGAFPEQLLENELFGHARGAYTDARNEQKGLAALAEGGTLFLDEIDALSLPSQAKLLRFLENRVYKPLGAERFSDADVRVLAATNHDVEICVKEKRFRADLFFRLNVFRLRMAPLRERRSDIPLLARHFLASLYEGKDGERKILSPAAVQRLALYDWPGNVRELLNVIQRAVVFADGREILPSHVSLPFPGAAADGPVSFREARSRAIEEFERAYIEEILYRHHGNITRAAREAGKDRRAFGRLVKKHHQMSGQPA